MVVAARIGFEMEDALKRAEETYVKVNIHDDAYKEQAARLKSLPASCAASADELEAARDAFEAKGVFSKRMIDGIRKKLRSYDDAKLRESLQGDQMLEEVRKYWHCG